MNESREPGSAPAQPGEIVAMGLLHEIFHMLVERYEDEAAKGTLEGAADDLERSSAPTRARSCAVSPRSSRATGSPSRRPKSWRSSS